MKTEELDTVEKWCADILDAYNEGGSVLANRLCTYNDALPTKSIRSQMVALAAEVRRLQTAPERDWVREPWSPADIVYDAAAVGGLQYQNQNGERE